MIDLQGVEYKHKGNKQDLSHGWTNHDSIHTISEAINTAEVYNQQLGLLRHALSNHDSVHTVLKFCQSNCGLQQAVFTQDLNPGFFNDSIQAILKAIDPIMFTITS